MLWMKEDGHPGSASSSPSGSACCFTAVTAGPPAVPMAPRPLPAWAPLQLHPTAAEDEAPLEDQVTTDEGPAGEECTSAPLRLAPALAELIAVSLQQGTPRRLSVSSAGPGSPGLFGSPPPRGASLFDEPRKRSACGGAGPTGPAPARRRVSAPGSAWHDGAAAGLASPRGGGLGASPGPQQQQAPHTEPPGQGSSPVRRLGALRPLRLDFDTLAPPLAALTPRGLASPLATPAQPPPPRLPLLVVPESPVVAAAAALPQWPHCGAAGPAVTPSPKEWIDSLEAQLSSRRRSSSSGGGAGGAGGLVPPAFVCLGLMGGRCD